VLLGVATRELLQGLPAVAREVRVWRSLAQAIPDAALRQDALSSLARKRGHTDGAALFWTIPAVDSRDLLRLLVAYEVLWDFLDSVNEHGASAGQRNGRQLHLALIEALDPVRPISDYYLHHPWREDGSYLRALVEVCREACSRLPSYERIRASVIQEATRAQVLAINHDLDAGCRDRTLRDWATHEFPVGHEATWFELTGAASASLTVHVLLALGAEETCTEAQLARARDAYFPWISAATTMLDSYVDQLEDAVNGDHSYVAHYPSPELAAERISWLLRRSIGEARSLADPEHHVLIVACMAAMYLSKDSARDASLRTGAKRFVRAGGSLTQTLLPILRLWRIAYAQRST
jgi:tetraprenyl-beta-curcumene synthase